MNPFSNELLTSPYSGLEPVVFSDKVYVDAKQLLDILAKRGMLALRVGVAPGANSHTTDFESGRFEEMRSLYEALSECTHNKI